MAPKAYKDPITYGPTGWPESHAYRTLPPVPTRRPDGQLYTDSELNRLECWRAQLLGMSRKAWDSLHEETGRTRVLRAAGWSEVMPGQWVLNVRGPMRTQEAAQIASPRRRRK